MSEDVFFNPGDSISSAFDFDNAYVAAQIYHRKAEKPVLVAKEKDGKAYFVFDEAVAIAQEHEEAKRYAVVKRLK